MRLPIRLHIEQAGFTITLQNVEQALESRLEEGRLLIASGLFDGRIYLLGYVAEMLLKIGYMKVVSPGIRPTANVGSYNKQALTVGKTLNPYIDADGFHSILFWAVLIEGIRRGKNLPLPSSFAIEFEQRTRRLQQNWKVDMRYLPPRATLAEATEMLEDVLWLRREQSAIWS